MKRHIKEFLQKLVYGTLGVLAILGIVYLLSKAPEVAGYLSGH